MLTDELMREVKRLEIRARRRVDDLLSGQYHSAFKGQGIEFSEVREYQPGDEVRWIDWNVTARTGHPFVKRFQEERQLTVILAVDAGLTTAFGSTARTKLRLAAEVAAVLTLAAARNNDLVGLHLMGAETPLHLPPSKGRTHTLRVLRELLSAQPAAAPNSLGDAISHLHQATRRRAVVFLISDLLEGLEQPDDPSWAVPLRLLARKHDVVALTTSDPRERELPDAGMLRVSDPTTVRTAVLDTGSARVRAQYFQAAMDDDRRIDRLLNQARVDRVALSTDRPFGTDLARYLRNRDRRR